MLLPFMVKAQPLMRRRLLSSARRAAPPDLAMLEVNVEALMMPRAPELAYMAPP